MPMLLLDILEEHFEELQILWEQRTRALRSPRYTLPALRDLDERIGAHVEGLLVSGDDVPAFVKEGLSADDPLVVFAAGYTMLRLGQEGPARQVLDAFLGAKEGRLKGLHQALCQAPLTTPEVLQQALGSAAAPVALAAADVLAFHGRLAAQPARLGDFLRHEGPSLRAAAWRVLARAHLSLRPDAYQAGLTDPDPQVQREALWAAAWQQYAPILDRCRALAEEPTPERWDAHYLLAILGKPRDLPLIRKVVQAVGLGPQRLDAAAAFGHPDLMELILAGLESADVRTAVAAAKAFATFTGLNIESSQRVQVPPADGHEPDEFEKEFLDEVKLPDARRARDYWQKEAARFRPGTRWSHSLNVSDGIPPQAHGVLHLQARWEASLRGKFEKTWTGTMSDLEAFPQKTKRD